MSLAHMLFILACSAGQLGNGSQADDGYTYRIGEVNPYNDNSWYRYYRGVGSGSRINKLYNEIHARWRQSQADLRYWEECGHRYDEGRRRWYSLNTDYRRELTAYNTAARALEDAKQTKEGWNDRDRTLYDMLTRPNARQYFDAEGKLIDDKYIEDLKEDLDARKTKLDGMSAELDRIALELNQFAADMNMYVQGAERNNAAIKAMSNDYQLLVHAEQVRSRNADSFNRTVSQYQSLMGWMHAYWSQFPGYGGYGGYAGAGNGAPSYGYGSRGRLWGLRSEAIGHARPRPEALNPRRALVSRPAHGAGRTIVDRLRRARRTRVRSVGAPNRRTSMRRLVRPSRRKAVATGALLARGFGRPGFRTPMIPMYRRVSDTHDPHVPYETRRIKVAPRARSFFVGYLTPQVDLILLSTNVTMDTISVVDARRCFRSLTDAHIRPAPDRR